MQVEIAGPSGSFDRKAMWSLYDFTKPTAGNYSIQIELPDRRNFTVGPRKRNLELDED